MITHFIEESIILGFLSAFIIVLFATPSVIKVSFLKNLVDVPDDERKFHTNNIPTLGGILIFAATIFTCLLWFPTEVLQEKKQLLEAINEARIILSCLIILFFVGVKDDIIGTAPVKKLLAHLAVAFILVLMGDIRITSFKGIFGIYEIPYWTSILLSVFTYTVIVNGFNLIDGIDGLAGGVGLISSLAFGVWFYFAENPLMSLLAFSLGGSLLGFLMFNFSPAKIFMGDSGSLSIGLIISVLAIQLIEQDVKTLPSWLIYTSKPVFVLSCLAYPLVDTLRVFIFRAVKGRSPFSADRNHIHHRLLDIGLNHTWASLVIYMYSITIIVASVFINFNPSVNLAIMFSLAIILSQIPFYFKSKNKIKLNVVKTIHEIPAPIQKITLN